MRHLAVLATLIATLFHPYPTKAETTDYESPGCFKPFHNILAPSIGRFASQHVDFYRYSTGKGRVGVTQRAEESDTYGNWLQRLDLLGISPRLVSSVSSYHQPRCNYALAVKRLDERMANLGRDHPYVSTWVRNQMTVFENCEQPRTDFDLPTEPGPQGPDTAVLAAADFAYQTATAYFYSRHWPEAFAAYAAISADSHSPYRGLTGYMAARSLMNDGRPAEADTQLRTVLADPLAADVQTIAEELRDVVAYDSGDPLLLTEQLQRNVAALEMPAERIVASDELVAKYEQAKTDLAWFLRGYRQDLPLDWWLTEVAISEYDERALATRMAARSSDLIDWLQTMQSSDLFAANGWAMLFSTLVRSPSYDSVTRHAVEKWHETGAMHWALAAIMRAKPTDSVATEILELFEQTESRIGNCTYRFGDRELYGFLLYHSIRLLAMAGETDRALALVKRHAEVAFGGYGGVAYKDFLRWLVGRGEIESARELDSLFQERFKAGYPDDLHLLRQIIAPSLSEFLSIVGRGKISDGTASVINLLPVEILRTMIDSNDLLPEDRKTLARVAWTRAFLLDRKNLFDELSLKLRLLNRELDLHFDRIDAAGSETERHNLLTYIILETPRLNMRFNPQQSERVSHWGGYRRNLFEADNHNSNDNNWWCRFDHRNYWTTLQQDFFDSVTEPSFAEFDDAQRAEFAAIRDRVLANHPVLKLVDEGELAALSQIDNAPVYLGRRALAWARDKGWFAWLRSPDPLVPKTLHLAVRATRYGCRIDPDYGEISHEAFRILHKEYPDSPWTQLTPYWFDPK